MLALGLATASLVATAQPAPAQTVSTLSAPTGAANVTTSSGLIYTSLKEGSGASPQATDTVRVHYRGTFPDGKEFDSSYSRGQPAQFPLNRVIRCWTEGVQMIKVGGKARLVCPPAIAYGERGTPGARSHRTPRCTSRWSCWASRASSGPDGNTHGACLHDAQDDQRV